MAKKKKKKHNFLELLLGFCILAMILMSMPNTDYGRIAMGVFVLFLLFCLVYSKLVEMRWIK